MNKLRKIGIISALIGLFSAIFPQEIASQTSYLSIYELSLFSSLIPRDSSTDETLAWLLAADPNMNWRKEQELSNKLHQQIASLRQEKEKFSNDRDFLFSVYRWTRRNYLRHYGQYHTLPETLQRGEYNCVSGTALLAYILERLGYECNIRETNRHVYLLVKVSNTRILIESTDPFKGFTENADEILARVQHYNAQYVGETSLVKREGLLCTGNLKINRTIDLKKLAGLQYYNMAVQHYLATSYSESALAAQKAEYLYTSQRNQSFLLLLANL